MTFFCYFVFFKDKKVFERLLFVIFILVVFVTIDTLYQFMNYSSKNGFGEDLLGFKSNWYGRLTGPFGDEFVTAGGVDLGEINLATMESRCCPGLHLAGELMDVDGVTGGFNFQACWSGGWLAGQAIAADLNRSGQRS